MAPLAGMSSAALLGRALRSSITSLPVRALSSSSRLANKSAPQPARDMMTGELIQLPDIDPSLLKITKATASKERPSNSQLVFGKTFTDHMLTVPWSQASGWGAPEIKPYGPLDLDPACVVFHYGSCLFEGMKAYCGEDGSIRIFRPDKNMARMNRSAARIKLPAFDGEAVTELIKKLVLMDKHWIPKDKGFSLYIRPVMIGTQRSVSIGPSIEALMYCILSPVGPYYPTGFKPISLLATNKYVRAFPKGTGSYKLGLNYATTIMPQSEAAKEGYSQILWLLGEEDELTEVGAMNLFVAFKQKDGSVELVTPPLGDIILPGVIRDSCLSLTRQHEAGDKIPGLPEKLKVSERKLVMADLLKAEKEGTLLEVFGTGTAAVVSPVDKIGYNGKEINIPVPAGGMGNIAKALLERIQGIQTGAIEHEWSVVCGNMTDA